MSRLGRVIAPGALPLALLLVLGLGVPAAVFFVYGFWTSDIFGIHHDWTLDGYRTALSGFYLSTLLRTLVIGATVAVVVVVVAYALAYVTTFRLRRGRNIVVALVVASAIASYLVRIYAWKTVLGPNGALNSVLQTVGLVDEPVSWLLYSRFAVVVALVQILLPFAFIPIYGALQSVDRDVVQASHDLGAGRLTMLRRVLLPLTWPGVVTGFTFAFIIAAGDYVTPELLGGRGSVMTGRLVNDQFGTTQNYALASALAFVLLASFAVLLLGSRGLRRGAGRVQRSTRPARLRLRRRRISRGRASIAGLVVVLAFLYVPLVTMILLSVNASSFAAFPMTGLTTHWYAAILDAGTYRSAFGTSLLVAVIVTAVALAVGVPAAFALMRRRFLVRPLLSGALVASLGLPGIVIGFAIFALVIEAGFEPSLLSVVIGQLVILVPFVVLSLGARLQRMDPSLEEAARDLGCTPRGVLRRVTLPLVAPVLVGGGLMVFALSMDEFVVTHFTIGDQETFPVLIWAQLHRRGLDPSVNAAATLLVLTTLLAFLAAGLVTRSRRGAGLARDLSAAAGGEAR